MAKKALKKVQESTWVDYLGLGLAIVSLIFCLVPLLVHLFAIPALILGVIGAQKGIKLGKANVIVAGVAVGLNTLYMVGVFLVTAISVVSAT